MYKLNLTGTISFLYSVICGLRDCSIFRNDFINGKIFGNIYNEHEMRFLILYKALI